MQVLQLIRRCDWHLCDDGFNTNTFGSLLASVYTSSVGGDGEGSRVAITATTDRGPPYWRMSLHLVPNFARNSCIDTSKCLSPAGHSCLVPIGLVLNPSEVDQLVQQLDLCTQIFEGWGGLKGKTWLEDAKVEWYFLNLPYVTWNVQEWCEFGKAMSVFQYVI